MEECIYCKSGTPNDNLNKPLLQNKKGLVFLSITGVTVVLINAMAFPFVMPALRRICLPFVPATASQIKYVMKALSHRSGKVLDLGSGDGRIVLEAAKRGFSATGVELNPWLVWYSRIRAYSLGLGHLVKFYQRDLWKIDLSHYDNIIIFGVEPMMKNLEEKLTKELSETGSVIACRFPLPSWKPSVVFGSGLDTVWFYTRPKQLHHLYKTS